MTGRLAGLVVAATRDDTPDDPFVLLLRAEGAEVVRWPTLSFGPPADPAALEQALRGLAAGAYGWLVCTSARGAAAVGPAASYPRDVNVGAVGQATARALEAAGWRVDVVGDEDAAALVAALAATGDLRGQRVLFPAASRAGTVLERELAELGAEVDRVEAYTTDLVPPDPERVLADLERGVDVAAFASPSAVASLQEGLGRAWPGALARTAVAAIGPSTEAALVEAGIGRDRITTAHPPGFDALVDACVAAVRKNQRNGS